ncbi:MAG: hypothetical protein ACFFG0_01040 [Candidatus Thorarchaeota archaeon]
MIYANTTSDRPTHFLRAVELIVKAREKYNIPSENWPYPTRDRFGIPNDRYYAEVWTDGMDWQPSYWVIEEKNLEKPQVHPLIIFSENEHRMKFNEYDFSQLIRAALWYRRDEYFIKQNDLGYFTDSVWPFLFTVKNTYNHALFEVYFQHASQERINFIMNSEFIPLEYLGNKWNKNKNLIGDCNPL